MKSWIEVFLSMYLFYGAYKSTTKPNPFISTAIKQYTDNMQV